MSVDISGRRKPTKPKKQARAQKRKREDVDVDKLQEAVDALDLKDSFKNFTDLPLSEPTKAGLKSCHFSTLTEIQAKAIAAGLKGSDILGAARTGSGKTLAFVIPVLENLFRQQCIGADAGLGAMIISPTRELAIQIFDVLYKIGKHGHLFAAGLIIGGKSLQEEQQALARMNIVVCTPGRMLQHLSQTAAFNVDSLSMLVLDEADRIMDMGFQRDVDAIVEYLPPSRQTLLFSATQTKKVSDLSRLALRDPQYIAVHEAATNATPAKLQQNYVLTTLPNKLDTLWSFLQSAKKSKLIVFLSSGKEVRFVYESFRRMQPGIPLLHLHGRQKQTARLDINHRFSSSRNACLFATDVAARGLDFPAVDWVVQVDCPEDADTYIHRVGRTARYERDGRAVLFLDPSEEEGMLERLSTKKVPIERINIRQKKQRSIKDQMQSMLFKDPELKYLGQKAFTSYVRSVHVQKDKDIFNVNAYDWETYASSLGLPGAPKIRFVKGDAEAAKKAKNAPRMALSESEEDGAESEEDQEKDKKKATDKVRTKYDRMFERTNQDILTGHYQRMVENGDAPAEPLQGTSKADSDDDDDDLFTIKRRIPAPTDLPTVSLVNGKPLIIDSHRREKALKSKKAVAKLTGVSGQRLVFDEDTGTMVPADPFIDEHEALGPDAAAKEAKRREFVEREEAALKEIDKVDRAVAKEKRREKKIKRKESEKRQAAEAAAEESDGLEQGSGLEVMENPFAELADLYDDEGNRLPSPEGSDGEEERPAKKPKWFENEKHVQRRKEQDEEAEEPQTLEDLERMAAGLLD
ncbi:hypothetical protein FH972_022326 [Carpinus fangiana]|uniref:ATP-dependent RNA helicase n=1 Tax=Carpinus fangiana TaxID=176857 RepID=A0A5N6KSL3_9ROSI|nr:hypothetical protein FH972_022326 [Carpinus fangiana]